MKEYIYMQPWQCDQFGTSYRESAELQASADAIYQSRSHGYDSVHREIFERYAGKTLLLRRTRGKDMPGWFGIAEAQ